jgi:hypothetical protein
MPVSVTAFRTPMIEPSFAPKKPFKSGLAWMIAFRQVGRLQLVAAPYWTSTTSMFGYASAMRSVKPDAVDAGAAGLVVAITAT